MSQPSAGVFRAMLQGTAVYSVAVLAGRLSSFLLMPVYTRFLTLSDWGVLELLELTLYSFGTLIGMRLGDGLMYYMAKYEDPELKRRLLGTAFLGAFALSAAFAAAGYLSAPSLSLLVFGDPKYTYHFRLMFLSFLFTLPQEVGLAYMRVMNFSTHYLYASLTRLVIGALFNLTMIVGFRAGAIGMLWGGVATSLVMSVGFGIYCLRASRLTLEFDLLRKLVHYGAPLGFGGLGFLVMHYGDRFFLKQYGLETVGLYAVGYKIGMLISYVQTPFDIYWRGQMFQLIKGPDGERLYVRVCTYLILVQATLLVVFAVFSEPVLNLMAGPSFVAAAVFVPWVALAYAIRTVGSHLRSVFLLEGKTYQETAVVWPSALVCLAGYYFLIPRYQAWGAIASTAIAFGVMLVIAFVKAQGVRRFPFEYRRIGLLVILSGAASILGAMLSPEGFWLKLAWGFGVTGAFLSSLVVCGFFEADERNAAARFLRGLTEKGFWGLIADKRSL